jgi:hypothetical protein
VLGVLVVIGIGTLAGVGFGALGMLLAFRAKNASTVQGIFPLVFVILFVSSAFFPRDLLSAPADWLAAYNPLSYIAEGMREPIVDGLDAGRSSPATARAIGLARGGRPGGAARTAGPAGRHVTVAANLRVILALSRRALNEILRVPGGAVPGVLAPTIFMIGLSGVFGEAANLPEFAGDVGTDFRTFIVPVGMLQGAGFTGAATGVNLARDIEQGWFDRLLVGPAPRTVLLAGLVGSACLRSLLPATFLVVVALLLGTGIESIGGLVLAAFLVMGMAASMAVLGLDRRAALRHAAGRAAHADRGLRLDPLHHRLRPGAAAGRLAAGDRRGQPGPLHPRGDPAGLRLRPHADAHAGGLRGTRRAAARPRRLRDPRDAARRPLGRGQAAVDLAVGVARRDPVVVVDRPGEVLEQRGDARLGVVGGQHVGRLRDDREARRGDELVQAARRDRAG